MAYIQDWGMRVQAQPQINTTRRAFLHLSQNENGRMLNIRITDVNIPAGSTAVLAGTKPDGTVYSQAGTLSGNTATFAEDVQMTAVVGTWDAKITVTNGGNCICTARITIAIDPDTVAGGAIPSDSQLDGIIAECRAIADSVRKETYGSPLVADAVEDMTDQSRVYVYTGSESGMTAGHWYYYNGSAWTDGGVYNAVAVDTDTTLSIAGKAADAKEVGDQLTSVKEDLLELQEGGYVADEQQIQEKVDAYLDEHPEATTTVQDGAITEAKLADSLKLKTIKDYVTPEMYGAKGDGTTDDTEAIQSALASGRDVYFGKKTYCVSETLVLSGSINMGSDTTIKAIDTMASVFSATNIGDRLRFIGGVIDCNSNADSGIALSGVNGAYIQNLKILNAVESSIEITSGSHNWVIGCKLYNQSTMAKGIESNSPDLKVIDCEIYYTECGIEQTYGILFVANTHIWSGGALNESTSSVGIRMSAQTNPRLLANSLYLDSFYVGVDFGTAVGDLKMSECLFYWATTTTPQECYGVKLGANSNVNLNNCLFQTYSPIVKHDILYGTQIIDYSEPKKDATADFGVTSNASKTILTATVIKGILYVDFVVKILALTADSTNWYPIIESVSLPSERMLVSRLDFAVFNNTKNKGAIARVGVFAANNIIRIHVNGDLSINDVIYGSIAIPIV